MRPDTALTLRVDTITGMKHCGHCWQKRKPEGGKTYVDAAGRRKWICAACIAKKAAAKAQAR